MNNAQALGREAMTAVGGLSGLFSIMWNLFWFFVFSGFLLIVFAVGIVVVWKLISWSRTISVASFLGPVISEVKGAFGTTTATIPDAPQSDQVGDPLLIKNQILDAVSPMAAQGDPAIAAAKKATNETEALRLTVAFLSAKNATGGAT